MGKRKPAKPEAPRFKLVQLSAVVLANELEVGEDQEWVSQADACEMLQVSDRTLRNWADIGLPNRPGLHGKPLYPFPDCRTWADCYRVKAAYAQRWKRPGPTWLTMLEALNHEQLERADGYGDNYVVIPTDVSADNRARMLRIAAEGIADGEVEPTDPDEMWLAEHAPDTPRHYMRLDIGWPYHNGSPGDPVFEPDTPGEAA